MKFRPCIDLHNGKVKQIVGGTLRDDSKGLVENFVSDRDAAYYATLFKKDG
ncbi:MAG: phosphoribosylformimino-5-aminoimidazole carboxamide ribotide isomerase, partial [Bacillota bacterium]